MKRATLILAIFTLISFSVHAQNGRADNPSLAELETRHKKAAETGDLTLAGNIELQISGLNANDTETGDLPAVPGMEISEDSERDWHSSDKIVQAGLIKPSIDSGKTMDIKVGEDGVLYSAVCWLQNSPTYPNVITVRKSTDNGSTWNYIIGYQYSSYVGSLSMLVESRDNSKADSTRIIVFFTLSSASNLSNATVNYFSVRSNGTAPSNAQIAVPPAGKKFCHVSALSDGAFYAGATYFGVVFTESDNTPAFASLTRTRYFRTINWGSTWTNSILTTGTADYFPSADYKEGTSDSVYIAVERRSSENEVGIYLLKTSFTPSTSFTLKAVRTIINGEKIFRKPCLAIQQTSPVQEMVVTFSHNNMPFFSRYSNDWQLLIFLQNISSSFSVFTHVVAAGEGLNPFSAICMTSGGDSLNVIKIAVSSSVIFTYKTNSQKASGKTQPVGSIRTGSQKNLINIMYAGCSVTQDSLTNAYSDYEGNKIINLKLSLQGLYNPASNKLSTRDTVRIYLKRYEDVTETVDSGKAVIDSATLNCTFSFSYLPDTYCYLIVRHRNSLETWSYWPVMIENPVTSYDMTNSSGAAYGNNLIQTDNAPVVFSVFSGDVNQDGSIDATDLSQIDNASYVFASGYVNTDLNGDGFVDASDASVADNNAANFVGLIRP